MFCLRCGYNDVGKTYKMDIYKIDVTGPDPFKKGYGIIVLYNQKHPYAFRLPSSLQSEIRRLFNNGFYKFDNKFILKPRTYSSILFLILEQIAKENQTHDTDFDLHLCNDFDGHQNDIAHLLKNMCLNNLIFKEFSIDNYHFRKHPKKSMIQQLALQVGKGDFTGINKVKIDSSRLHSLISKKKK